MTPFEQFFTKEFPRRLASVKPEGRAAELIGYDLRTASWDRRAAFLLWDALGRPDGDDEDDTSGLELL